MKSILFLGLGIIFLIVGLIPVVNIISTMGVLLIMVFDSLDYSFENMRMGLSERLTFFKSHLAMFSGFAVALGVILLVPGLNFFFFPSSVVGAAILIKKIKEEKIGT